MVSEEKGPETRCNPGSVTDLLKQLTPEVRAELVERGLDKMTKLQLRSLTYRKTCGDLWHNSILHNDTDQIEIRINDHASLWITVEVVQHVLDLPRGSLKEFPKIDSEESEHEFNKMFSALWYVTQNFRRKKAPAKKQQDNQDQQGADEHRNEEMEDANRQGDHEQANASNLPNPDTMHYEDKRKIFTPLNIALLFEHARDDGVSALVDTNMLVRLYLATWLDKMLVPGAGSWISKTALDRIYHIDKMSQMDWAHLVFECMKDAYKTKDTKYTMPFCVPVLLVVFADCIVGNPLTMEESGRLNLYTDSLLKQLLEDDHCFCDHCFCEMLTND